MVNSTTNGRWYRWHATLLIWFLKIINNEFAFLNRKRRAAFSVTRPIPSLFRYSLDIHSIQRTLIGEIRNVGEIRRRNSRIQRAQSGYQYYARWIIGLFQYSLDIPSMQRTLIGEIEFADKPQEVSGYSRHIRTVPAGVLAYSEILRMAIVFKAL